MTVHPRSDSHVDVLIIGAGPAGLMCANALVHAGVKVRIVDKRAVPVSVGHADGIHPRTSEVFQTYGLAERLHREGVKCYRTAFYDPGPDGIIRTARTESVFASTARYPYSVLRHQGGIEGIFHDAMAPKGLVVERPLIPTSIEWSQSRTDLEDPNAYPVKVTLKNLNSSDHEDETVHAKFVLGSDGAHSWVRKALNIRMEGDHTNSIWGVVDVVPDSDFPDLRNCAYIHSKYGTLMNIPREGDMVRFYIQMPSDTDFVDCETGRVDLTRASPHKIMESAAKIMHPYRISMAEEPEWWTVYIIGQRVAEKMSVEDRIFIAGDACHTHSPKAGQGMNASMADTHNLAWKLAYVLRGWADMSLIKTYESERLKFAQDLINFDKMWSKLFKDKPQTQEHADGVSHEEFRAMHRKSRDFASGIDIRYEPSAIVDPKHQSCASKLIVGERMIPYDFVRAADVNPLNIHDAMPSDTRFKILVFPGDISVGETMDRARGLAKRMDSPDGFLKRFGQGDHEKVFDVICVCATSKDDMDHTDVPQPLRSHWSKVLLDDKGVYDCPGGGAGYEAYGISKADGAIVVVRPDGYVGMVAPFEQVDDIARYFSTFMLERASS